jgi:hypothetical protein
MCFKKLLIAGSALALGTVLSAGVGNAQDQPTQPEKKMERSGGGDCGANEDCAPTGGTKLDSNDNAQAEHFSMLQLSACKS